MQEMLAPIKASVDKSGLHETFVTDLADQCYRWVGRCTVTAAACDIWHGVVQVEGGSVADFDTSHGVGWL